MALAITAAQAIMCDHIYAHTRWSKIKAFLVAVITSWFVKQSVRDLNLTIHLDFIGVSLRTRLVWVIWNVTFTTLAFPAKGGVYFREEAVRFPRTWHQNLSSA